MTQQPFLFILVAAVLFIADYYIYDGLKQTFPQKTKRKLKWPTAFWGFSILIIILLFAAIFLKKGVGSRSAIYLAFCLQFSLKFVFALFLIFDDARRLVIWLKRNKSAINKPLKPPAPEAIPRSEFLVKAGLISASLPVFGFGITAIKGLYDYHVRRVNLYLPNLPKTFDGLTLGQISDIHAGSLNNKTAVKGGVEMLLAARPDMIFFTGDLVNDRAYEMDGYQDIFAKVKAPLGVFSSLGNHDYGDYTHDWLPGEKLKNHLDLIATHKNMGWTLLQNENKRVKVNGEEIGILGCENWGTLSRFPKYGRMALTTKNTD